MKHIGLSAQELFEWAIIEELSTHADLGKEFDNEIKNNKALLNADFLRAAFDGMKSEAILRAVAVMIEKNNIVLQEQLKSLGVLPNQE